MEDIVGKTVRSYAVSKRVGSGEIFLAMNTATGIDYFMCRYPAGTTYILGSRKIKKLKHFEHENILCLWETFNSKFYIYAFYKYSGEEVLTSYVQSRGELPEAEVKAIAQQVVAA